jgi:hypothetical protein
MNAAPRSPERTTPSLSILATWVVVRHEQRELGHVAVGAVGIGGADGDLLGGVLAFEHDLLGEDLDAGDLGDARGVVLGAVGDPLEDGLVVLRVGVVELVARMRDGADGLLDERALLGDGEVDAAALMSVAGQTHVVAVGVHAEQGEAEAVLAAGGAVAAAGCRSWRGGRPA